MIELQMPARHIQYNTHTYLVDICGGTLTMEVCGCLYCKGHLYILGKPQKEKFFVHSQTPSEREREGGTVFGKEMSKLWALGLGAAAI